MLYSLYGFWLSTCTWRVRIVLNLKNIRYNYVPINLLEGVQKNDDYKHLNNLEQVPTLIGKNFKLTQSMAIIQYLESAHPLPSLTPNDHLLKAKMFEICEIINSGIQPLQNLSMLKKIKELGGNPKEFAQEVIRKGFVSVEDLLSENHGKYCIGDEITLADAFLVPQIGNALRYGVNMSSYPQVMSVLEELNKVPEIIKAAPENQIDAIK